MDWAILLAMPVMLLAGMMGDAISRDDDEGGAAEESEPEERLEEETALMRAESEELLAAATEVEIEPLELVAEPGAETGEAEPGASSDSAPEMLASMMEMPEIEETSAPEGEAEERAGDEAETPVGDAEGETTAETGTGEVEETGEPEIVEGFDPAEEVLFVEGPAEDLRMSMTDEGVLVELAQARVLLAGLSEMPGPGAILPVSLSG